MSIQSDSPAKIDATPDKVGHVAVGSGFSPTSGQDIIHRVEQHASQIEEKKDEKDDHPASGGH